MKVLSLFDGISCGMLALQRAGIPVECYDAFEIDKYAVTVSKRNFPVIVHHGNVYDGDFTQFKGYDLLLGGSPCTYWSIAKKDREIDCNGEGFRLFKNKTEYIRDCVRARVDITPDNREISETNRLMKRIGSNINQILIRLHSTGHIFAEDIDEIKRGVNEIWHTLLSIRSGQQSAQRSLTSQMEIRPSTVYMSTLMLAEPTAQEQAKISELSETQEQDEHKSSHTT